jgi:dUTP pyrophosphatase
MKFKKTADWAKVPRLGTPGSAGIDLFISDLFIETELPPEGLMVIDTGLAFEIPEGYYGLIQSRSSAFIRGLMVEGVLDSDFRGSAKLLIRNIGNSPISIEPGKSYAQLIICPCEKISLEESAELSVTSRGYGGFGSTGMK